MMYLMTMSGDVLRAATLSEIFNANVKFSPDGKTVLSADNVTVDGKEYMLATLETDVYGNECAVPADPNAAPKGKTLSIEIEIPTRHMYDAIEGARIGYWGNVTHHVREPRAITVRDREDGDVEYTLRDSDFALAIALMAKHAPTHFGYLMAGRADAETGDLLIQLACFGEEKYA